MGTMLPVPEPSSHFIHIICKYRRGRLTSLKKGHSQPLLMCKRWYAGCAFTCLRPILVRCVFIMSDGLISPVNACMHARRPGECVRGASVKIGFISRTSPSLLPSWARQTRLFIPPLFFTTCRDKMSPPLITRLWTPPNSTRAAL